MANPPTLKTRISAFVQTIEGVTDGRVLANKWRAEIRHHGDKTPSTQKLYVSKYREAIRAAYGEQAIALTYCKHQAAVTSEVRANYKARVAQEHHNLIPMPNWREPLAAARALLDSDDPLKITAGLLLVTGRRSYEIGAIAQLTTITLQTGDHTKSYDKWHMAFSGQAKTRGAPGTKSGETYTIPVLAPATVINRAYARLRASSIGNSMWQATGAEFSKRLAHRINNTVLIEFTPFFSETAPVTTKALRALYAEIAHHAFGKAGQSKPAFFAQILGHQEWDVETSLSYMDYCLTDDTEQAQKTIKEAQNHLVQLAKNRGDKWAQGQE